VNEKNLTIAFTTDRTPDEAFAAITDVRGWWSGEIEGPTDELGASFTYRYQDIHRSTQQITELVPGRRVAWHVVDGYLGFVEDKTEWTGTDITFDITPTDSGPGGMGGARGDGGREPSMQGASPPCQTTEVRFTHVGLTPDGECFDSCSNAWGFYITGSLRNLIANGQGEPNPQESPTGP
jgi:hypothetical protein